jgi:hypothetical protein
LEETEHRAVADQAEEMAAIIRIILVTEIKVATVAHTVVVAVAVMVDIIPAVRLVSVGKAVQEQCVLFGVQL